MEDETRQKHNNTRDVVRVEVGYKHRMSVWLLTWAQKSEVTNHSAFLFQTYDIIYLGSEKRLAVDDGFDTRRRRRMFSSPLCWI